MLDRVPGLVRGHAHGGHRGPAVDVRGEAQRARPGIIVIRQHSIDPFDLHVGEAVAAQDLLGGRRPGEAGADRHLAVPRVGRPHPELRVERKEDGREHNDHRRVPEPKHRVHHLT